MSNRATWGGPFCRPSSRSTLGFGVLARVYGYSNLKTNRDPALAGSRAGGSSELANDDADLVGDVVDFLVRGEPAQTEADR
jgi:hypothetical protein